MIGSVSRKRKGGPEAAFAMGVRQDSAAAGLRPTAGPHHSA
ncbi:hypothetical protein X805_03630 [Sphaerotilus natans subsp. natans DSM 6575]|uniref:Uncharacterized protein n=1 Tax=Sphaerotilus natans subsp. natans DSM 6575 TaxID=1286631 RepID=A0A059KS10_9BURK|nr:hypothetical protein X805_03630 [Sphaerotilus natans subsp. natans DSM 6575]